MTTTFHIVTFGCKTNQYESQAIREALTAAGLRDAGDSETADTIIINTCGVTGRAGASCRNAIRKARRANPGGRVVVTGCGVDLGEYPASPEDNILVVPNAKKHGLSGLLQKPAPGQDEVGAVPDNRFGHAISCFHGHTRAFIKVQDGCDNFCSYCAVPFARGTPQSRDPAAIRDEARRLTEHGHRELVLTGINIGNYRHGSLGLPELVSMLAGTPGLVRLRLGSVEPPTLTPDLVQAMASSAAVCPHIHLPLQSGDDGVLAAMGRRYSAGDFMEKVSLLRAGLANPAVTTDVIVGFPGETDAAVERTLAVCREAGLSRLHVFLFSPRPGTKAAGLRRTASDRVIEERKIRLLELGKEAAESFAASCVGLRERVIVERGGLGVTDRYVPLRPEERAAEGLAASVTVTEAAGQELRGKVLHVLR